jgi:hypothetical protein
MAAVLPTLTLRVLSVFVASSGGGCVTRVFVHRLLPHLPNPIDMFAAIRFSGHLERISHCAQRRGIQELLASQSTGLLRFARNDG